MQLLTLIGMVIAIGCVVFALQNAAAVTVGFLAWQFSSSLGVLLLIAVVLGGLVVALVSTPGTIRRQWRIKQLEKQVAQLEKANLEQKLQLARLGGEAPAPMPEALSPESQVVF